MKKQVRKILSALLVLTMLLSTLPAAVYAEAGDVEPIATPTVEPIEEPIVETIATPVPEATEEPTEEPIIEVTAEPAGEPTAEPVVEPTEEPAAMPAAPAELTDAQQAALHALPDGFSAQAVAAAMLSSNNCAHTVFHIQVTWAEETYTRIDDENHRYTGKITQKKLVCGNCGATLQTISVNEVYDEVYGHDWVMDIDSTSPYDFVCSSCGAKKRFTSACSHTNVYQGEDGNLHCSDCGAITYVFEKNECQHKNITIIQPDTVLTWYDQWDAKTHVKYTATWHYDDTTYVDAECDDCGISIICDRNGNNCSYGTTDTAGSYTNEKSAMEAHSFENGVCAQCGYVQSETDPDTCDHSAGNYNDVLDTDIAPVYSNITAESHCVQYSYKRYCKDCNAYIGNVTDEGITPVPHDFGTGDTCACGYKKAETPEDAPYVRGFTMSASTIKLGETVTFTLDIANAKAGDVLTLEFCADTGKYKEEFTLTYPDNVFTHEFSQDGNRSICFRVVGGEYCAAQTLIVEASKAGIDSAKLSLSNLSVVEKAEGETIRATVTCNNQTGVAELYVGSAKNYASSDDYDVVDGRRVFEVEVTLGGNGKSYAGDYKIWVNALKGAYQAVDATYNLGTLKVTHTYTAQSEPAGSYYEKSVNGHTLYNKTKITETCSVCGDQKETTQKKPAGNEEPHVGLTENGKCSVCGYSGWSVEEYEKEVARLKELSADVYKDLCAGNNAIGKAYPNGFGQKTGKYICGTFVGLQAIKMGFQYLNCFGKPYQGQPNGKDWCNYARDYYNDWGSNTNGLGKDLIITNTIDGKEYKQSIYLEKDSENGSCLYDLLEANENKNIYNVIISYSQKTTKTSADGHVRYIYAILKDPATDRWMVYFTDNQYISSPFGQYNEGELICTYLENFIKGTKDTYYTNGIVHFEPVE